MKKIPLIERLRTMGQSGWNPIGNEAADAIETLSAEVSSLKKDLSHWKYVAADYEISCTQQEIERLHEAIRQIMGSIADVDGTMTAWLIGQAALGATVSGSPEQERLGGT